MAKDKRCKCTLAQSLVGDGCRYCHPQEYIDRLQDTIDDLWKDIEKLENDRTTIWRIEVEDKNG